ncbi:2-keto-4-pentenoate hydratase/2-oxohepta-3-ene-1,7-dioic acid hydratase in catechol pathway [Arcanobacterium wilhelmae]|uniref:2-keto-4-pentenoate hydratase/2-oxohepta-3-ene-1,7-dioic acid hydratase in catechol pathway n=1 Tax=Arcanobacterium wilhelmae TaxID=1803177 RepID=A0ABT9ND08_9ACTO|nr:fumarylacetoacetate hydrolase family protein [Arcanobacterium wilhelmae]MDP9801605.1 2-keto-4-pentenoate hydratase/2-oxohepta-3-ene-1,7-dioic acid hydratase in catechol pathway [Arcanobacterium wilhelmae]WFN90928.1 fumarylacetoacetate hydrolase family protein [Arcanobacterium wilhelmae]
MKIARLSLESGPRFGVADETGNYHIIAGDPIYSGIEQTGKVVREAEANLVSPMIPRSKVVGVAGNFGQEIDGLAFLKPNTAVVGPDVPITVPTWSTQVAVAGSLAVIIKRICKDVEPEQVGEVIFGYTGAIDATDVASLKQGWLAEAKGFDTSLPLGPVIETSLDTTSLEMALEVNGEVRASGNTVDFTRSVPEIVSRMSKVFTLLPGDVILLGHPGELVPVEAGDDVRLTIEGIGTLRNPVA